MVRGKFRLDEVTAYGHYSGKLLKFSAVSDSATEENRRFAKATPSGTLEMQVDNPSAAEFFQLGKSYYLDFTAAE